MSHKKSYQYNYSPADEAVQARKQARSNAFYTVITLLAFAAIGAMFAIAA